jgi:DNA invertase Pin-like site-specific DNA recombinase
MTQQILAIVNCRVSSKEQELNNSLKRQRGAVLQAANELNATIPNDGWWSGSVSSKRGTNVNRKDLQEMMEYCKKNKRVKYLIVDEPDRFMRSINEASYFEVLFEILGVKVWYASESGLNKDDLASKLLKFTKYLSAEGSNEERQNKSISGQTKALMEGRYPFPPKAGYKRGYEKAIPEIDEARGPALQSVLIRLASRIITPTEAVKELNQSSFVKSRAAYKMDKFRVIATDPFYAGVVEIHKQVNVRNEGGLHESLISMEQHQAIVRIMNDKKKTQSGPRKNGNPKYPLSNLVSCSLCADKKIGRYVGYDHGNGKNKALVYEKYRCRSCARYLSRQEMHEKIQKYFADNAITPQGRKIILQALDVVWKQEESKAGQEAGRIKSKITSLTAQIDEQVEAATDPSNASIKENILLAIAKKKHEIDELEEQLESLTSSAQANKDQFMKFAYDFIDTNGTKFLELSSENRLKCKQILFPAGFYLDENNKVYTPKMSPLYRLASIKKGTEVPKMSTMVRVRGL